MQQLLLKSKKLLNHFENYLMNRVESAKLTLAEKISKILANIISVVILSMFLFCCLLFASLALAYGLSVWIGKISWALLIVGGFYLLAGVIVWNAREKLLRQPILNAFLRHVFEDDKNHE